MSWDSFCIGLVIGLGVGLSSTFFLLAHLCRILARLLRSTV